MRPADEVMRKLSSAPSRDSFFVGSRLKATTLCTGRDACHFLVGKVDLQLLNRAGIGSRGILATSNLQAAEA